MWVVVKDVTMADGTHDGLAIGPFTSKEEAELHIKQSTAGSLGYEKWTVWRLEKPAF